METLRGKKARRSAAKDDRAPASKTWLRFKRSTTEDRQQLTQNEAEPGACSSVPNTDPHCSATDADFTRIRFAPYRAATTAPVRAGPADESRRAETGSDRHAYVINRDGAVPASSTDARKYDRPSTEVNRNMAPNVEGTYAHDASAAAVAGAPSPLLSSIYDGAVDCEAIVLRDADDESGDEFDDSSPTGEQLPCESESSTASFGGRARNADPEADGTRVRSAKRRNRKQRVKRIAKRVRVFVVAQFKVLSMTPSVENVAPVADENSNV
jgi:hypothetical protein